MKPFKYADAQRMDERINNLYDKLFDTNHRCERLEVHCKRLEDVVATHANTLQALKKKPVSYDPNLCVDFAGETYTSTDDLLRASHHIDEALNMCLNRMLGDIPINYISAIRRVRTYIEEQAQEAIKILQDNEGKK